MKDLKIFENNEFGEVRTSIIDDEPYFSLNDVCRILEINNPRMAKTRLNGDGVSTTDGVDSLGRRTDVTMISEANLYKLIFQSRKAEAERFANWVTSEVLPAIRRDGIYMTEKKAEEILANPDAIIEIANKWKRAEAKLSLAETKIEEDKPKVLFAETVAASKQSCLVGELAKLISQEAIRTGKSDRAIGQNKLFKWMRDKGYLCRHGARKNQPKQTYIEQGLFEIKKGSYIDGAGASITTTTTKVTGKGQVYFVNKFLS